MNVEEDINYKGYELTVRGEYDPGEEMVMYYDDMSGHPGTPADFEAKEIYFGKEPILTFLVDIGADKAVSEIEDEVLSICEEKKKG